MVTEREAKYLKIIYEMEESGWIIVGAQQVAEKMGITRASAYEALMKLSGKGLLKHYPKKGFALTNKGRCLVKRLIRTHRIIETMLVELFNVPLDRACECAARLEIVFSQDIVERIFGFLGEPECCPHGEPIPSLDECEEGAENVC